MALRVSKAVLQEFLESIHTSRLQY